MPTDSRCRLKPRLLITLWGPRASRAHACPLSISWPERSQEQSELDQRLSFAIRVPQVLTGIPSRFLTWRDNGLTTTKPIWSLIHVYGRVVQNIVCRFMLVQMILPFPTTQYRKWGFPNLFLFSNWQLTTEEEFNQDKQCSGRVLSLY